MTTIDLNKIEDIITRYGLQSKSRHREMIWNRYALYNFMRNNGFGLNKIGKLVGKDHATVLHGLRTYEQNKKYSDFQGYILEIENDLNLTYEHYIQQTDDICLNEMICLANLETLITEKL